MTEKRSGSSSKKVRKKGDKKVDDVLDEPVEEQPSEPTFGTYIFQNGASYEGQVVQFGERGIMRHGKGKLIDGNVIYDGDWVEDAMEGEGTLKLGDGSVYTGQFKQNTYNNQGEYKWEDGSYYTGSWFNGKMHGQGVYSHADGTKWTGQFYNGSGPELVKPVVAPK